jgi:hypothetical protein
MMAYMPGSPSAMNPSGAQVSYPLYQRSVDFMMDNKSHVAAFGLVALGIAALWFIARKD